MAKRNRHQLSLQRYGIPVLIGGNLILWPMLLAYLYFTKEVPPIPALKIRGPLNQPVEVIQCSGDPMNLCYTNGTHLPPTQSFVLFPQHYPDYHPGPLSLFDAHNSRAFDLKRRANKAGGSPNDKALTPTHQRPHLGR